MTLSLSALAAARRHAAAAGLRLIEYGIAAGLAVMLALVFTNAVLRYLFDSGIAEAEEIAMLLLVWTTFLGAVVALMRNEHLGIELLERFGEPVRLAAAILADGLMLSVAGLLLRGSWVQVEVNRVNSLPVTGICMSWLYAAGVAAGVLLVLVLGGQLANKLQRGWLVFRGVRGTPDPSNGVLRQEPAE